MLLLSLCELHFQLFQQWSLHYDSSVRRWILYFSLGSSFFENQAACLYRSCHVHGSSNFLQSYLVILGFGEIRNRCIDLCSFLYFDEKREPLQNWNHKYNHSLDCHWSHRIHHLIFLCFTLQWSYEFHLCQLFGWCLSWWSIFRW